MGHAKRARAESAALALSPSPLDDNEIFGAVLSYVGFGEYFYVSGVCRKWRGRYISFCHAHAPAAEKHKLRTLREAVIVTAARLQLALNNGARLTVLDVSDRVGSRRTRSARTIVSKSLEPIAVLSLLRVYGYEWEDCLYAEAAKKGSLELIKWLHQVQCPAPPPGNIALACCTYTTPAAASILQWLHSLQPDWFAHSNDNSIISQTWLLQVAGMHSNWAVMQWLRCDLKAEWPDVDDIICDEDEHTVVPRWDVEAVIWALDNGLEFEFECSKLDPAKQTEEVYRTDAVALWQWLHKESNRHRCTCSNAQ
jgi:hypothetical protein